MACRLCQSKNVTRFAGELNANSPHLSNVRSSPVYVCQEVLVCLDCGFAELLVPPKELALLRKSNSGLGS